VARSASIPIVLAEQIPIEDPLFLVYLSATLVWLWRRRADLDARLVVGRIRTRDGVPYRIEIDPSSGLPGLFREGERRDLVPDTGESITLRITTVIVSFFLAPEVDDAAMSRVVRAAMQNAGQSKMRVDKPGEQRLEAIFQRTADSVCNSLRLC
jgi:hypothetical protein